MFGVQVEYCCPAENQKSNRGYKEKAVAGIIKQTNWRPESGKYNSLVPKTKSKEFMELIALIIDGALSPKNANSNVEEARL